MKQIKNLASWTTSLFTAFVMVCGMVMFASCTNEEAPMMMSMSIDVDPPTPGPGGIKIINDSLQEDSILYEGVVYKTILKRSLKALDRREVVVDNFDGQTFDETFTAVQGEEKYARQDGKFLIYGRETVYTKNVSVAGHVEEVSYTLYQERATFTLNYYEFEYINWNVRNASDDFAPALISTMDKKNELDYRNEIATTYYGYNQKAHEIVAWFSGDEPKVVDHYDTTGDRNDKPTFTTVTYEKFAIYNDGSRESVAKDSENLPIRIVPETNWTINVDNLGTYVSNAFAKTLISKTPRKQGNFSYNEYCYRVYNTVAGQTNSFLIYVPNDIVREDKDARMEYKNTDLVVNKGAESTTFKTEDDSKKVYAYSVVANVVFGASQSVNLPGTINVKKAEVTPPANHEHGKVKTVLFTSTIDENRSFYKSVCVIVFEDGYRSIGMAENSANAFNFNMSSYTNGVNSTVYAGGKWIPSIAVDENSDGCMVWYDESRNPKRTYDFLSANRNKWNNGHNTVVDVRRSYTLIDGGYGVTLKLNGNTGQTLHF